MERDAMLVCQHIVFEIWPKHRLKIYTKELFFIFTKGMGHGVGGGTP